MALRPMLLALNSDGAVFNSGGLVLNSGGAVTTPNWPQRQFGSPLTPPNLKIGQINRKIVLICMNTLTLL